MRRNILIIIILTIVVDFYFFDVTFRFFPIANTKMILAVFGAMAYVYHGIQKGRAQLSKRVLISGILALVFSLWCYFSIVMNGSNNREFVTYFASFATWLGGAYGVYTILGFRYEKVSLTTITFYLATVCLSQCIIALLIDNIPFIRNLVNSVFLLTIEFYERANRLYGIGCALDPAGVRFSAVLVLIAHQLANVDSIRSSSRKSTFLIITILVITVIGSMISRTTIVGTVLALAYILFSNFRMQRGGIITKAQVNGTLLLFFLIAGVAIISTILYNTSSEFHEDLRFGFEGFFNWVETGDFHTTSTDQLKQMWIWPTTRRGWIIGEGRVGVYETNSDIGYCNYILYCGLIGLIIYSIYYIYNHLSLISKFKDFTITAFLLVAVTFIIWSKVTTDIFLVDALLFCIDDDFSLRADSSLEEVEEDNESA